MPTPSIQRQKPLVRAIGAVVIALLVGLGGLEIYFDYRKTMDSAFDRLETLARIADENVSGLMRTIDVMLQDVAREAQAAEGPRDEEALLAYMTARVASLNGVRSISVMDANGKVALTTLSALSGFDGSQRPYYTVPHTADDKQRLFIQGPIKAATGAVTLFASRAKPLVDGAWDGVVLASLPPAYFSAILASVRPQDDGFAALLGIEGTIIARAPGQEVFSGRNIARSPTHSAHVASGQRTTRSLVTTSTDIRRRLVVSRTTDFPELVIAVGWAEEAVLADWRSRSLIKGGIVGLLVVVALLALRRFAQHEGELLTQRNFARQLVETANVMVVGLDRDGIVRVFNETAERITGFAKADILGRSWFQTITLGDGMADIAAAFRAGQPLPRQFDGAVRTRRGGDRVISWQNSIVSGQSIVSMSFGIDITGRLEAERERIASQRFIQAIADNMPGMVGYWDLDLRCRFANTSYLDWFGKTPDQIIGRTMVDLLGAPLFAINEPYVKAALRGEVQRFERTLIKANGETGYTWAHYIPDIDAEGRVVGFFVLVTDITPLKTVENALRATSERLALATKAGGIGVWEHDLVAGSLTWDDRMFQLYGVDPATTEPVYAMWRSRCLPSDLPRVEADLETAIRNGTGFDSEFRILGPADAIRHIKAAAVIERDGDGQPVRLIGVNWDLTVVRENEAALAAAQVAAERANSAKSEFLANMSHEIRTPLNAVLGLSHLLERTRLTDEQRDFAAKIRVAGRGLLSIINDILDFSRVEAGRLDLEIAEFQLPDLLNAVSTIMSVNASTKDLELVIDTAPGTPCGLIGDALRLQQVLINLTGNAIKFTERGAVTLRAERVGAVASAVNGTAVLRFTVEDSGIGMSAGVLSTVFDAFSQADSSTTRHYGGSGLGLAICKRLVGLMGGQIGVESELGLGSRFWFTVPLGVCAAAPPDRAGTGTGRLDVLIADDHDVARTVIAGAAEALGWTTETASSGREALERAQDRLRSESPFDVLILDWQMPELDGLAVSRIVRTLSGLHQSPIVIMVTAYNREILQRVQGAESVDAILVKPVTGSSLHDAVMEARARRAGTAAVLVTEPGHAVSRLDAVRLLVVEDNGINQEVARRILELEGAVVTIAADGRQALDRMAADPSAFDAVLMDVQMPVMDGYEATRRLRRDFAGTPVPIIALTAGALAEERVRAREAGMDDFIAKPFDIDQMVQCIRRHVAAPQPSAPSEPPALPPRPAPDAAFETVAIPGIDRRQALLRLGGDHTLFASLLPRFIDEFAQTIPHTRADLAAGNTAEAMRRLHALRGAAGNIAAVDIAARTQDLEGAIRENRQTDLPMLLERLDEVFDALALHIRHGKAFATVVRVPVEEDGPRATPDDLRLLLDALETRSMGAITLFDRLHPVLARSLAAAPLAALSREIDALMFDEAARRLRGLFAELRREGMVVSGGGDAR